ncbi:MAG: hypothetical protein WAZ27_03770 [Minisyncoccia bacterium]
MKKAYGVVLITAGIFFLLGLVADPEYGIISFLVVPIYTVIGLGVVGLFHIASVLGARFGRSSNQSYNLDHRSGRHTAEAVILIALVAFVLYGLLLDPEVFSRVLADLFFTSSM